jgi:transcriptional repressor NrdR
MRCPQCTLDSDRVIDSRPADDGAATRRRRECQSCGHRYTTFERVEASPVVVRKRTGLTEPYSGDKLRLSLMRAAADRPRLAEQVEALAVSIESAVVVLHGPQIPSRVLGSEVLERLKHLDEVAYLRYASVHKGFETSEDFQREIDALSAARGASEGLSQATEGTHGKA